jgi:hypothetical protein
MVKPSLRPRCIFTPRFLLFTSIRFSVPAYRPKARRSASSGDKPALMIFFWASASS